MGINSVLIWRTALLGRLIAEEPEPSGRKDKKQPALETTGTKGVLGMTDKEKLDKVEELVDKTGASYADARAALEEHEWNMLDAIVALEEQHKTENQTARYSTAPTGMPSGEMSQAQAQWEHDSRRSGASDFVSELWQRVKTVCSYLMERSLIMERGGRELAKIPLLVVLIAVLVAWKPLIVAFIVSLFFEVRYRLSDPIVVTVDIDEAMGKASDAASEIRSHLDKDAADGSGTQHEGVDES